MLAALLLTSAIILGVIFRHRHHDAATPASPLASSHSVGGGALPNYGAYPECDWQEFRLPVGIAPARYDLKMGVNLAPPYQVSAKPLNVLISFWDYIRQDSPAVDSRC